MAPRDTALVGRQIMAFEKGFTTALLWQARSALYFGCFFSLSRYAV